MKMLLSCGGTGGLIYPAVAIAETMKRMIPDLEIVFVGGKEGLEKDLITHEGYPFEAVNVSGFARSKSVRSVFTNLKTSLEAVTSVNEAGKILQKHSPDLVVGTGGYACWPALRAAAKMKIPCAVHESNVEPGLAVKALLGKMDKVFVNFEETAEALRGHANVERVGIPVRNGFAGMSREEAKERLGIGKDRKLIVSFGGSGGAEYMNEGILKMMKIYDTVHPEIVHIHAAGKRPGVYEEAKASFDALGLGDNDRISLVPYIYDMPLRMAAADLVICRAGAMTISELAMLGKCAALVPSPYVTNQHQYKNAKALEDKGACAIIYDKDETKFTGKEFADVVDRLMKDDAQREKMSVKIKSFALPDANERIAQQLIKMLRG